MINPVRVMLAIGWMIVAWATFRAGSTLGLGVAGDIFFADLSHPWRGQFNLDFLGHLLLVAAWLVWSASSRTLGIAYGLLAILGGGLFTFAYLLVQTFRQDRTIASLVLGRNYREPMPS
jgi:hypothetical protein